VSSLRARSAVAALKVTNAASRALGRGQGTVAGGRVGLRLDPGLLGALATGRELALVSGTNGKTTTTALLVAALGAEGEAVLSNSTGSNMPAGHVAALAAAPGILRGVLEVDEGYLGQVLEATGARVVVLLNLSRDQLDRMSEVRMLAERWRTALAAAPSCAVVANADDPLVVFAAGSAAIPIWVAAGLAWREDAVGCPACGGRICFEEGGWHCERCELARPKPDWWLEGDLARSGDRLLPLRLALPGAFNRDNALLALAAAAQLGVDVEMAASAMGTVVDVGGRFVVTELAGSPVRLMLAKNPAGWAALLDLVATAPAPVVVSINARTADGLDPSWLWDVPFGRLAGRRVLATGERFRDLSVRLAYAGVEHTCAEDPLEAVRLAAAGAEGPVDVIGNYTAFHELLAER
jgi:UDP-N-acetylmuramyl tripeptide synthase